MQGRTRTRDQLLTNLVAAQQLTDEQIRARAAELLAQAPPDIRDGSDRVKALHIRGQILPWFNDGERMLVSPEEHVRFLDARQRIVEVVHDWLREREAVSA